MRLTKYIVVITVLAALVLPAVPVWAANWQWQLPRERYQRLNQFERAQYDKASKLYEQRQFEAAAAEFEKFCVQFEDTEMAYMRLMRAMSLHNANNRNQAIKVYQDVIDYFGSVERYRDEVVAATYWRGVAYLDSGDMRNGLMVMKKMVENPNFRTHILTAGALRRLADNHFANTEYESAVKYWQQTIRDFRKLNDEEVKYANDNYVWYTMISKGYRGYDNFFMNIATGEEKENPAYRANYMDAFYQRAHGLYHWHEAWRWRKIWPLDRDQAKHNALVAAEVKAYYDYVRASKSAYEGANRHWTYYNMCMQIACQTSGDKPEREKLTQEAVAWIKTLGEENKDRQDQYYARIVEYLAGARESQLARYVKAQMHDKLFAEYQESHILQSEGKNREACTVLEGVEAAAKGQLAVQALNRRAHLLHHYVPDYEQAVKAYSTMTNPPHNLWDIADVYWRWSGGGRGDAAKFRQCLNSLAEIEASFPDWAPRAAWQMSHLCANAGDEAGAIRHARRVVRQYPKSGGYASAAHQYLESKGIKDIGGGVGEEIK